MCFLPSNIKLIVDTFPQATSLFFFGCFTRYFWRGYHCKYLSAETDVNILIVLVLAWFSLVATLVGVVLFFPSDADTYLRSVDG